MTAQFSKAICYKFTFIILLFNSLILHAQETAQTCQDNGEYRFICGMNSPEDLLLLPNSDYVIASGFAGNNALYIIDSTSKAFDVFYPGETPVAKQNMALYGNCPGSPNPNNFTGHGLNLRQVSEQLSTLYVVGHGEREAIEVFEVDTSKVKPEIVWVGCVLTPEGLAANSVASLGDGSLLITIPLREGVNINDIFALKSTGSVYTWSKGDTTFTKIKGSDLRYPNGIEVSADGQEYYVASSGDLKVMAFSNSNPTKLLRSTGILEIVPDNLRRAKDGKLISAGMKLKDPNCGDISPSTDMNFGAFATCPRGFQAISVLPKSMQVKPMAESASRAEFSNASMVLEVNDELWFGTLNGDRIAYTTIKR